MRLPCTKGECFLPVDRVTTGRGKPGRGGDALACFIFRFLRRPQQAKEDAAVLASKLEAAERRIADNEARSTKAEAVTKATGLQHTAELAEYKNTLQQTIGERDRYHAELLKLQATAAAAADQHTTTLAELGIVRQQASEARESAANLAGRIEAMETKIAATAPAAELAPAPEPAHPKTKQ